MKYLIVLIVLPLTFFLIKETPEQIVKFAPYHSVFINNTITAFQSGNWSDPATWRGAFPSATDTVYIPPGITVTLDLNTTVSGVNCDGTLISNNGNVLQSSGNVVIQGLFQSHKGTLCFININESNFIGGGMDVLQSDVGLWVMGNGKLDLQGAKKTSWTNAAGSVSQGAISITVLKDSNWNIGDEIVINPTDDFQNGVQGWDAVNNKPIDLFADHFEKRIITAINGNIVSFNEPLKYNHLQVKSWTAEVANLTRSVIIEGTETGRSHIFIRSTQRQNIKYVEGRYLGPRKVQAGSNNPQLVSGRYGLHFHHCDDGSIGSIVEGCSFHDLGNRVYVPHMSDGIRFKDCIGFNSLEEFVWWDSQEPTNNVRINHCLFALGQHNGVNNERNGSQIGVGDNNSMTNCVAVYVGQIQGAASGAYMWGRNNSSEWFFENNLAHTTLTGIGVDRGADIPNVITNFSAYNCGKGIIDGGYLGDFIYRGGYLYKSPVEIAQVASSDYQAFQDMTFDGGGVTDYLVNVHDGILESDKTDKIIKCNFINYTQAGVHMYFDGNYKTKHLDLIECTFSGTPYKIENNVFEGSYIRMQNGSSASQAIVQSGSVITTTIAPFAPSFWGTGPGLKAEYHNGLNFESLAFKRVDPMPHADQGVFRNYSDFMNAPTGVNHLLTSKDISIRWLGSLQPQQTGYYLFKTESGHLSAGGGTMKVWINGNSIISETNVDNGTLTGLSNSIYLEKGKLYPIKIEYSNVYANEQWPQPGSIYFYWNYNGQWLDVPMSQLYPYQQAVIASQKDSKHLPCPTMCNLSISVYPNPSTSYFHVSAKSDSEEPIHIYVYNDKGVLVRSFVNEGIVKDLPKGYYKLLAEQFGVKKSLTLIKF